MTRSKSHGGRRTPAGGRPRTLPESTKVTVRIANSVIDELNAQSRVACLPVSQLIRIAIAEYLGHSID